MLIALRAGGEGGILPLVQQEIPVMMVKPTGGTGDFIGFPQRGLDAYRDGDNLIRDMFRGTVRRLSAQLVEHTVKQN